MTMTAAVDATGAWTATFATGGGCQCTKLISVKASCSDGLCEASFEGPLPCQVVEDECPKIDTVTVTVDGCADGMGATATATFTVTLNPPGSGCTFVWHFGDGSPNVTTSVPTVTHVYTTPGSFAAIVTANCPPVAGNPCTSRAPTTVVVPPCNGCPTVVGLTAAVSGCAGPGVATVSFSGTLTPPIAGCTFLWSFGDGSPSLLTTTPSATHAYALPATYAVAVTPICPNIPPCSTTTIAVVVKRCCPILTDINFNVEDNDCADGMGTSATMIFAAVTDPTPAAGSYTWNFGDGTPLVTNPGSNATHDYAAPGTYTVSVVYTPNPAMFPGCPAQTFSVSTVVVPACSGGGGGGGGDDGGDGGEGGFCFGARVVMTIAAILGIVSLSLAACIPPAAPALLWLALGFGILAGLAGLIWGFLCPKPCAWALLLAWQVSLGVGFILLYFTLCCPAFWPIGLGLLAVGISLMLLWKKRCKKSNCAVLKELVIALSGVVLPLLGWLGVIPALAACINPIVAGVLSTLAAAATLAAASCVP
jgi:PKD repeat protein